MFLFNYFSNNSSGKQLPCKNYYQSTIWNNKGSCYKCYITEIKNASRKIKSSNSILHFLLPPSHTRLVCDFFVCLKQIANEGNVVKRMQYSVVLSQENRELANHLSFWSTVQKMREIMQCNTLKKKQTNKQTDQTQLGHTC